MTSDQYSKKKEQLLGFILDAERDEANALLDKIAEDTGHTQMIQMVLEPVLTEIGEMWSADAISLAQGYVAGKIAEDVLEKAVLAESSFLSEGAAKGPVVIGNIEDDYHALGRKMVGTFLRMAGWEVHDLGNDVAAEEFVSKAVEVNAVIIGASAMMYTTAKNILTLRQAIDAAGLKDKVRLAVGGAVFKLRPEMVQEVGGDGTAESAVNTPSLFDSLLAELSGTKQGTGQ